MVRVVFAEEDKYETVVIHCNDRSDALKLAALLDPLVLIVAAS